MKNFNEMTLTEMRDEFNRLTDSKVNRFASRSIAEKRLSQARELFAPKKEVVKVEAPKPAPKKEVVKPAAKQGEAKGRNTASKSIAESWKVQEVRSARLTRNGVKCNGVGFKSVRAAFLALHLPLGSHIKFRMVLKANGSHTLEHKGNKFEFKLA